MMATMARVTRLLLKEWEVTVDTEEMKDLVEEAKKTEEMMGSEELSGPGQVQFFLSR